MDRKTLLKLEDTEITRVIAQRAQNSIPTSKKQFKSRSIMILTGKDNKMRIRIMGKEEAITGNVLISENTRNPDPLEIGIDGELLQHPDNPEYLFLKKGTVSISGEKKFSPLLRFEKSKVLERLPVADPDLTIIDGKEFRQTGTIQIRLEEAIINLLEERLDERI